MIPADVDIDDLSRQLAEDSVAFGAAVPAEKAAALEPGLIDAVAHADSTGFGSLGVVVLEHTPPHGPDLRDVAQELLMAGDLDTVLVRTPHLGAAVSDVHSRSEIESAQYPFLGNPDVVAGAHRFIDDINGMSVNWPLVAGLVALALVLAVVFTALAVRRRD